MANTAVNSLLFAIILLISGESLSQATPQNSRKIAVIGLGYVGLPIAVAFGRRGPVIAFDIDESRVAELRAGLDRSGEVSSHDLAQSELELTSDSEALLATDFFIVAVPTPVKSGGIPDLSPLISASRLVGKALKKGDIVVYESTVYPGATEDDCVPILEFESGLKHLVDFSAGYSPERINPGDKTHRLETIVKVVASSDNATLDIVAEVYESIIEAGIYRASSIKVAEAAKVIENTQRDINIALMNELSLIFHRLGIDTRDVLEVAKTKWNFLPFVPGLVGGHCIGVDPFYLTHKAQSVGYHPQMILAGRRINDGMGTFVAQAVIRHLLRVRVASPVVTILGLTFKEEVRDVRNTRVVDIVDQLKDLNIKVQVVDPNADPMQASREYGLVLSDSDHLEKADAVIVAVGHRAFREAGWEGVSALLRDGAGFVADVPCILDRDTKPSAIELWRL